MKHLLFRLKSFISACSLWMSISPMWYIHHVLLQPLFTHPLVMCCSVLVHHLIPTLSLFILLHQTLFISWHLLCIENSHSHYKVYGSAVLSLLSSGSDVCPALSAVCATCCTTGLRETLFWPNCKLYMDKLTMNMPLILKYAVILTMLCLRVKPRSHKVDF